MPYPLLRQLQRHSETIHQRDVRMAESMQTAALNSKAIKQWIQLPLNNQVLIPRCAEPCGEKPTAIVRLSMRKEFRKVSAKKRGQSKASVPVFAFRRLRFSSPHTPVHMDQPSV